jgi:hypothetical protein
VLEEYVDKLMDLSEKHSRLANQYYAEENESLGHSHAEVARAYAVAAVGLEQRLRGESV